LFFQEGIMPVFDQRGQHVNYQYNAAGNIKIAAIENRMELADQLEQLQVELVRAQSADINDEETAVDAEYQLKKAEQEAKKPEPDKKKIIEHHQEAKALLEGVTAAGEIVTALAKAAEVVQRLFYA
jgi:hypothetical protein